MRQIFYYKLRRFCYKLRQILQIASVLLQITSYITKCVVYYKLRQYSCMHTDRLFFNFRILKLFYQIYCHNILFIHQILNNKVPEYVCEIFVLMLHFHITRSNNQIIVPQTITICFGTYSTKYQCINALDIFFYLMWTPKITIIFFFVCEKLFEFLLSINS